jgi:hypothetical protein
MYFSMRLAGGWSRKRNKKPSSLCGGGWCNNGDFIINVGSRDRGLTILKSIILQYCLDFYAKH